MLRDPKARIARTSDQITVTVKCNGSEVVGAIGKKWPFTGKWQAPRFDYADQELVDVTIAKASRLQMALRVCVARTWEEWHKLPDEEKVKIRNR